MGVVIWPCHSVHVVDGVGTEATHTVSQQLEQSQQREQHRYSFQFWLQVSHYAVVTTLVAVLPLAPVYTFSGYMHATVGVL